MQKLSVRGFVGRQAPRGSVLRSLLFFLLLVNAVSLAWVTPTQAGWTRSGPMTISPADMRAASFLAIDPQNMQILYAVVDGSVYKSLDGGMSWSSSSSGLPDSPCNSLVVDPENPLILYALTNSGIYKSLDGALTWSLRSRISTSFLAIDPRNTTTLYAKGERLSKSIDGGATWTVLQSSPPKSVGVSSVAIFPQNPKVLFVGMPGSGVYRSTDGGVTWRHMTNLNNTNLPQIVVNPVNAQILYSFRVDGGGVQRSVDGGRNWTRLGIAGSYPPIRSLIIDPQNTQTLYAIGDSLYKSTDGGASWNSILWNCPSLVLDPRNPEVLYGAGSLSVGFCKSTDGGAHWSHFSPPLVQVNFSSVTADSQNPQTLYGLVRGGGRLFKSVDGGSNWNDLVWNVSQFFVYSQDTQILYTVGSGRDDSLRKSTNGGRAGGRSCNRSPAPSSSSIPRTRGRSTAFRMATASKRAPTAG